MTPPNAPIGLWDAKDVARFLKVSRSWVYLHAEAGDLPSIRIGALRRFVPGQIMALAEDGWQPATITQWRSSPTPRSAGRPEAA